MFTAKNNLVNIINLSKTEKSSPLKTNLLFPQNKKIENFTQLFIKSTENAKPASFPEKINLNNLLNLINENKIEVYIYSDSKMQNITSFFKSEKNIQNLIKEQGQKFEKENVHIYRNEIKKDNKEIKNNVNDAFLMYSFGVNDKGVDTKQTNHSNKQIISESNTKPEGSNLKYKQPIIPENNTETSSEENIIKLSKPIDNEFNVKHNQRVDKNNTIILNQVVIEENSSEHINVIPTELGVGKPVQQIITENKAKLTQPVILENNVRPVQHISTENNAKPEQQINLGNNVKVTQHVIIENNVKSTQTVNLENSVKQEQQINAENNVKPELQINLENNVKVVQNINPENNVKPVQNISTDNNIKSTQPVILENSVKLEQNINPENNVKPGLQINTNNNVKPTQPVILEKNIEVPQQITGEEERINAFRTEMGPVKPEQQINTNNNVKLTQPVILEKNVEIPQQITGEEERINAFRTEELPPAPLKEGGDNSERINAFRTVELPPAPLKEGGENSERINTFPTENVSVIKEQPNFKDDKIGKIYPKNKNISNIETLPSQRASFVSETNQRASLISEKNQRANLVSETKNYQPNNTSKEKKLHVNNIDLNKNQEKEKTSESQPSEIKQVKQPNDDKQTSMAQNLHIKDYKNMEVDSMENRVDFETIEIQNNQIVNEQSEIVPTEFQDESVVEIQSPSAESDVIEHNIQNFVESISEEIDAVHINESSLPEGINIETESFEINSSEEFIPTSSIEVTQIRNNIDLEQEYEIELNENILNENIEVINNPSETNVIDTNISTSDPIVLMDNFAPLEMTSVIDNETESLVTGISNENISMNSMSDIPNQSSLQVEQNNPLNHESADIIQTETPMSEIPNAMSTESIYSFRVLNSIELGTNEYVPYRMEEERINAFGTESENSERINAFPTETVEAKRVNPFPTLEEIQTHIQEEKPIIINYKTNSGQNIFEEVILEKSSLFENINELKSIGEVVQEAAFVSREVIEKQSYKQPNDSHRTQLNQKQESALASKEVEPVNSSSKNQSSSFNDMQNNSSNGNEVVQQSVFSRQTSSFIEIMNQQIITKAAELSKSIKHEIKTSFEVSTLNFGKINIQIAKEGSSLRIEMQIEDKEQETVIEENINELSTALKQFGFEQIDIKIDLNDNPKENNQFAKENQQRDEHKHDRQEQKEREQKTKENERKFGYNSFEFTA